MPAARGRGRLFVSDGPDAEGAAPERSAFLWNVSIISGHHGRIVADLRSNREAFTLRFFRWFVIMGAMYRRERQGEKG